LLAPPQVCLNSLSSRLIPGRPARLCLEIRVDSYRDFESWRKSSHSFEQLEALTWARVGQTLTWRGKPHSNLSEVEAIMLDGHFVIEHGARNSSGRFINFNGTAGMWRRRAIDDAGDGNAI
jgi:hypothetical protein